MIVGMVDDRALRLRQQVMPSVSRRQPRPTPQPVEPTPPSPLDNLASNYLRSAPQIAKTTAASNIFNPVPLATEAVNEGRVPSAAEAGLDAGFLAAGFLPVGKAASQLNAIVKRLNKSTDVRDFMTDRAMSPVTDYAMQGLYRGPNSVGGFTDANLPVPASQNLFGLVPTEKLAPLREFDRTLAPEGLGSIGPDNLKKLAEHMAEGGKWSDPLAAKYFPNSQWSYLAEGNHRLALAKALGLEQLPTTVWRSAGTPPSRTYGDVGKRVGALDTSQLTVDALGNPYIPPDMHPYLLKYFQPK
jgi:hypothetical protein